MPQEIALRDASKLTPEARVSVLGADTDLVDVIFELSKPSNVGPIGQRREEFHAVAEPVEAGIVAAGGEVLGKAWLNYTLRARVPGSALGSISGMDVVEAVDVPRLLTLD